MKVLALIERPQHVCYRYRIEAYASALFETGLHLEAVPLRQGRGPRVLRLPAAASAEVVILQRKLLPRWQLYLVRRFAKRLVYDMDDAVFQRDSFQRKGPKSPRRERMFRATVQAADAVIVGNEYLRRCAAQIDDSKPIHVVPTTVQPQHYPLTRHHRVGANVRLAWVGSSSTLPGLKLAERQLWAASERVRGLTLRLVCDRTVELDGLNVVLRPWAAATEAAELAHADIGISWLSDDSWSRGKCGLKVLQYMAAGLPVVANRVGMNRRMVIDGETGLLADTPEEWAQAIGRLAADPELRTRMGAAGRRLVEQHYSVDRWGPRFAQIIKAVACPEAIEFEAGSTKFEADCMDETSYPIGAAPERVLG